MTEYAFPKDLLGGIKDRWDTVPARQGFELPDEPTLLELLEACYHASLRTDERRPVHCAVAYAPIARVPDGALLRFERPIALTDDQLVRLAPVVDIRQTLIGCDQGDGSLRIWGLFEHGHAWAQYSTGDPPDAPVGEADLPPDCLTITIDEPGALTVSRGRRGLVRLRDGRVVLPKENPLRDGNDPLGMFFRQLIDDLGHSPRYRTPPASADGDAGRRSLLDIYTSSVAAILDRIRSRRHGGSVVITRTAIDEPLALVTYTVAEHAGLAGEIVAYHEALGHLSLLPAIPSDRASESEQRRAETTLRLASRRLIRGLNQISLLAAVDGAVLLDDHLRIQGFGVRFPVLLPPGSTIVDAVSGLDYACDQWGLRHQSVFSVCQRCEQAVGLIVSQDGGVKAVKSVEGRLHFWDGILD
jgi:Probable sensor domain DACNV